MKIFLSWSSYKILFVYMYIDHAYNRTPAVEALDHDT